MSSAVVAAQINVCNTEIDACREEIRQLQLEIEDLESILEKADMMKPKLEGNLSARASRAQTAGDDADKVKLASWYGPKMLEDITGTKMQGIMNRLSDARAGLMREISDRYTLLEEEETKLRQLETKLEDLNWQYQRELDRERRAREAAAAAAAAAAASRQ